MGEKIIFTFLSREDTVAAYKQSNLFLFPSNIECSPIVLFECAASKLPFLSTDVGNSIEIATWTKGGEIMPTIKTDDGFSKVNINEGAKMLNELYNNEFKRNKMAMMPFIFGVKNTVGKKSLKCMKNYISNYHHDYS